MENRSVRELIASRDPLSKDAIEYLLAHREEDAYVDYKEAFLPTDDKHWLELAKDILALANTNGGYLVFGVRNGDFELVGLPEGIAKHLQDVSRILNKVNPYIDPPVRLARSKSYRRDNRECVVVFVPPSSAETHVIARDGEFTYPSGEKKIVFRKGTLYVRKSGGNHLVDSRDLDEIVNRRLHHFRESLLDKIARVVEAPVASELVIVDRKDADELATKVRLSDDPTALPIRGLSFTTPPTTLEEEIASWIALHDKEPASIPPCQVLWRWFANRHTISISPSQSLRVARFCLLSKVPTFYWLQPCSHDEILAMVLEALGGPYTGSWREDALKLACFLGRGGYGRAKTHVGSYAPRLSNRVKAYPEAGPRSLFSVVNGRHSKRIDENDTGSDLERELDAIAGRSAGVSRPAVMDRHRAMQIDCHLYARDDQYRVARGSITPCPKVLPSQG